LQAGRKQPADDSRHVGLVVDDKEAAREAAFVGALSALRDGLRGLQ
jgi:lactoylglutathione lyase